MRLRAARTGIVCLGILAGVVSGCAKERDPINRVQSNALAKNFFVGQNLRDPADDPEFRMKSFNVGGTVGQSDYTIGEYSALDRVRWEITENLLIARKAYEVAPGADNRGTAQSDWKEKADDKTLVKTPNGAIVAAYRILSHFDIKRAYNTTTGEELNVVEENTTDRAWYDREYMRVDWTQNIVDGPNDPTKFFSQRLGGPATPVAYTAASPDADDAPHIEAENGYFDVTNKFTVEPETVQFPWGSIKKCQLVAYFTGSASYDCNPQEAVVRLSFAKVQPDEDFEPFEDDVAWHDVVGNMGGDGDAAQLSFGSAPRNGWDPQYGYTDALTKRYKNIHELFKASHQAATTCDSDLDADKNGTADACENAVTGYAGHAGSRCDLAVGKCTIPVRDREVKTMGYWFNHEAPDVLQDEVDPATNKPTKRGTLEDLTYSWNQLLEVSLAYRREVECRATGDGDRDSCHAEFFDGTGPESKVMVSFGNWLIDKVKPQAVDKGKPVLVACHNPVRTYDPEDPCGKPGEKARLGDQRKNFLVYWPFDSRAPYGGVAGVTPDPVTGEIRGASATIMGRSATYAAALQRDIIQVALGDTKIDDILKGVPADRYAAMVKSGSLAAPGLTQALPSTELSRRASLLDLDNLRRASGSSATATSVNAIDIAKLAAKTDTDSQALLSLVAKTDALTSKIHSYELEMLDKSMVSSALGTDPSVAATADLKTLASPLHGQDPLRVDAMRALYQESLAARGACFDDSMASGPGSVYLASLAGWFKQKYGNLDPVERGKRIYDDLWKEAVKGIGLHELGHSLGLRHNFASSWDAPNYDPQYWQLRTNEGAATGACDASRSGDNDTCMGPRYRDPMTADEQGVGPESRPAIDYFANTSTMEYQLERFGETVGLGTYDLHAMKTLYGRVIETFDDRVVPVAQQKNFAFQNFTQRTERTFVTLNNHVALAHYTEAARQMKLFDKARDCRPATEEEKALGGWRIVHNEVCAPPPKDHWAFDAFQSDELPSSGGLEGVKWHAKDRDGKDRVRWHYRYGEQYGSGGFFHAMMGDSGADVYELVQNLSQKFELTYPWAYFRRQNREFTTFSLPQAISSQYFARARAYHSQIARDLVGAKPADLGDDNTLAPAAAAQADLLGFLQKAILMPEPGNYVRTGSLGNGIALYDIAPNGMNGEFNVDITEGRFLGEDFDEMKGGSWDYQKFVSRAGFDVEKSLAMMQLVDPRPTVFAVSRENFLDDRNPMVSFRTDLPGSVDQLVGGVLAEDWAAVAPAVLDPKAPAVTPADLSTTTFDRPPSARVLFPNIGYTQQLQLAIYTAVFSRLSQDMTVIEKMRIWVDGDVAPNVPGARQVKFVDPNTGFTYTANRFDEQVGTHTIDRGIASRMIAHANDLAAKGDPTALQKYVGLMNAVRQISRALGEGPLGGNGGGGGDDESSR